MSQPAALDDMGLPPGYPYRPEWERTPREVATLIALPSKNHRPLLVDCRTEQERQLAAIAGSLFVPLHEIEGKLDDIRDRMEDDGSSTVIVHCHHGVRSLRATAVLRAAGLDAYSLAGGIDLWSKDIDRTIPTY